MTQRLTLSLAALAWAVAIYAAAKPCHLPETFDSSFIGGRLVIAERRGSGIIVDGSGSGIDVKLLAFPTAEGMHTINVAFPSHPEREVVVVFNKPGGDARYHRIKADVMWSAIEEAVTRLEHSTGHSSSSRAGDSSAGDASGPAHPPSLNK